MTARMIAAVFFLCLQGFASLKWEAGEVRQPAHPGDTVSGAVFICTNAGDSPVTFDNLEATCDCTSIRSQTEVIAPGEKGSVQAVFRFENRVGPQRKRFVVTDSNGEKHHLFLRVDIPETYRASTRELVWEPAENVAKISRFSNRSGVPIRIAAAESSNPVFHAEVREVKAGFEYDVIISPSGTGRAVIRVSTQPAEGQGPLIFTVYAFKRPH